MSEDFILSNNLIIFSGFFLTKEKSLFLTNMKLTLFILTISYDCLIASTIF